MSRWGARTCAFGQRLVAPLGADVGVLDEEREARPARAATAGKAVHHSTISPSSRVRLPCVTGPIEAPDARGRPRSAPAYRRGARRWRARRRRRPGRPRGVADRLREGRLAIVDPDELEVAAIGQPGDPVQRSAAGVPPAAGGVTMPSDDSSSVAAASGSAQAMTRWSMPRIMRTMLPASGRLTGPMRPATDRPAPGSHDRSTPTGSLEDERGEPVRCHARRPRAEERGGDLAPRCVLPNAHERHAPAPGAARARRGGEGGPGVGGQRRGSRWRSA